MAGSAGQVARCVNFGSVDGMTPELSAIFAEVGIREAPYQGRLKARETNSAKACEPLLDKYGPAALETALRLIVESGQVNAKCLRQDVITALTFLAAEGKAVYPRDLPPLRGIDLASADRLGKLLTAGRYMPAPAVLIGMIAPALLRDREVV